MKLERELLVIEARRRQDRRVQVVHTHTINHRLEADLIRLAVMITTAHTATSHPHGEGVGVVIATRFRCLL